MSDNKKPGTKNIQDLKAKLGLKKPGAGAAPEGEAPPPAVTPPPGVAPPAGDDVPAPPGAEPAGGVKPPPGVTPPPGVAPPAVTPSPATPAPGGDVVAPPGFQPPAAATPAPAAQGEPQFATTPSSEPIDLDLDSVQGKKSRRIVWILIAAGACLLTLGFGYYIGDTRLKRDWSAKSKESAKTTAELLKQLHKSTLRFEAVLEEEIGKTKKGRAELKTYNPNLFSRLEEATSAFDMEDPKLKALMKKQIWTTHYRFVPNAGDLLPRMHNYLAALQQLKIAVMIGRAMENDPKFAPQLAKKKPDAKGSKAAKHPEFGAYIKGNRGALFFKLGKPCNKEMKPIDKHSEAHGYQLPDDRCRPFTEPKQGADCPEYNDTVRIFGAQDKELYNRLKCKGLPDVVFKSWVYSVRQVQLVLKKIKGMKPKEIYTAFRKASQR